jgi:SAF domain
VPIQDVAARDIAAGDVVRLDDLQAQRVERAVHVDGRVVLELRPVGLEVSETGRVTLPSDRLVSRLGTAAQ